MLTRRQLVRRGAAGAAVLLLPAAEARAGALKEGRFRQGVLSGDPTPDGITLLTLLDDVEGAGSVQARGRDRRRVPQVVASQDDHDERRQRLLGQGAA